MINRVILLIIIIVTFAASTVFSATEKPEPQRMGSEAFARLNRGYQNPPSRTVFEGFEGGEIPEGWTVDGTSAGNKTWQVSNDLRISIEGRFAAYIDYDSNNPQNESLAFEYALSDGDDQLSFYMAGSRGSDWSENVTETVEIVHSCGTTVVFDFDTATETNHTYERFDIDLSVWDSETVTIVFRYEGIDGDIHYLDAISIDDGTGWIPPPIIVPENNTCADALFIEWGSFQINGDTTYADNNYNSGGFGCTGYHSTGNDVVYKIHLFWGADMEVTMTTTGNWDDSIYLIADCDDPQGSCVAGADEYPDGSHFEYENLTSGGQTLYLVVDGYDSSAHGEFQITGYVLPWWIPTEKTSFGTVKSLYR